MSDLRPVQATMAPFGTVTCLYIYSLIAVAQWLADSLIAVAQRLTDSLIAVAQSLADSLIAVAQSLADSLIQCRQVFLVTIYLYTRYIS